jgi:surface polysaccharide O-acyltransferase-like enzyme
LLTVRKPAPTTHGEGAGAAPVRLRLEGADALRALAAVAVVVVHTCHWPLQSSGADLRTWAWVDLASRFCVPAFVVLSGLLLGLRDGAGERPGAFLRRRLRRTLLPFLVWAPVYCAAGLWITGDITGDGVGGWLLGGAGHLYFLLLVPQLYLAYLVWPRRLEPALWLAAGAMAVQLALGVLRLAGPMPPDLDRLALWHGYELLPFWIGYFAVGVAAGRLLARRRDAGDHPRAALACLAAVPAALALLVASPVTRLRHGEFAQGTGAFLRPLLVPVVLALTGAALLGAPALLRRLPRLGGPVRAVSRDSLGVYILHPLIAFELGDDLLKPMLQQPLPGSIAGFLLLTAGTLALALLATRLISATPLAPLIGSERRPLRSAPHHDEGDQLLGGGHRPVVAHHPRLGGVD